MKLAAHILSFCVLIVLSSCSSDDSNNSPKNQFTDNRDGQTYETVKIGNQTWFAENLNYDAIGSQCYGNNNSNCFSYGRLYSANSALTACPDGWHLPSSDEWKELFDYLGGINTAHVFLAPGATLQGNLVGFNLLSSGQKGANFLSLNTKGYYWTSSPTGIPGSYKNYEYIPNTSIKLDGALSIGYLKSCRCIQD